VSVSDDLVGRPVADRYRIGLELAVGGMARVYRARDERLDRDVAVKVLSPPYADDPDFATRFLTEARAAASISHPSLVHVYDSGTDGATHFIVMELLDEHRSLRDILHTDGPLARDEVLRMGAELLSGLRAVHDRGLVHCDVKPANIMLGPGPAKLIDFGIATPPNDGSVGDTSIGTLATMSPEQLHGEALTPASDLYSLGAVLYEALTGRPPFIGSTPDEISAAQAAEAVRPPSTLVEGVPARLDEAILQALRRDPAARFRTADAMAVALGTASEELSATRTEETRVMRVPAGEAGGYVPPSLPPARLEPTPTPSTPRAPAPSHPRQPRSSGRGRAWSAIGTLLVLGAAAAVVVLVVVPLLDLGRAGGGSGAPSPTSSATASVSTVVVVPDFVGMPTRRAIDTANGANLDWTVRCNEDRDQPNGIVDQEPPAGTEVHPGAPVTLFSARIKDCR
jgi:serine/threonine-protein kinase